MPQPNPRRKPRGQPLLGPSRCCTRARSSQRWAARGLWLLCVLLMVVGCDPAWPASTDDGDAGALIEARVLPHASSAAVARVAHFEVAAATSVGPLDPQQWRLFRGKLGTYSMAQLEDQTPSASLLDRSVPALAWAQAEGAVRLAPRSPLEPGARYTLAAGEPLSAHEFVVATRDPLPLLRLMWPTHGRGAGAMFGVWCAPEVSTLSAAAEGTLRPLRFAVDGLEGPVSHGVGGALVGQCVSLPPMLAGPLERALPPLLYAEGGAALARLDPTPLSATAKVPESTSTTCEDSEVSFGPGCATLGDDRIWVRSLDDRLWIVTAVDGRAWIHGGAPDDSFVLQPLPPASALQLDIVSVTLSGAEQHHAAAVSTLAPMPHVIISEVLANPLGPEPHQEWVELYNDGSVAAALEEYRLLDVGGEAWLPAAMLEPGGYALIVKDSFDFDADYDVMIPEDAMVLSVAALGKNGLNNSGEPLSLRDASDRVVSRFSGQPKPVAGQSVARQLSVAEDAPEAFVIAAPTPGEAN